MKKETRQPYLINSVSELNKVLGLPCPPHPLVTLNKCEDIAKDIRMPANGMIMNLYKISYKHSISGKMRYGQNYYDFGEGGLVFISPNQLISDEEDARYDGFSLMIHPDFLRGYGLDKNIKNYGFFSYSANEALHLSEKEKETILGVFKNIEEELALPIDQFSQDVIISQVELLLNYSNRFYNRQFITRKPGSHDLLIKLDELLSDYFDGSKVQELGLPTVNYISGKLNISANYLSDMLRTLTGQSTQQHIHNKLIEKAKDILTTTSFSVSEIAYQLGFEHPQSFSKLFKNKTNISPLGFRHTFE
jgi:AraC family transcriptional activator of pobA